MRAAVNRAVGAELTLEEVRLAPPGPGEVEVRIRACAICHSDLMFLDGHWGDATPAVWGHEAAGEVITCGAGVSDLAPGDRVVVTMVRSCGACACCSAGLYGSCTAPHPRDTESALRDAAGHPLLQGMKTGAFAERVLVDRSQLVPVAGPIGWAEASLLGCGVITGYGAVKNTARLPAGASAVVIGAGGVGLNTVQSAALLGAAPVIAVDIAPERLAFAESLGATHCVNAATEDPIAAVKRLTGGGADFVFATVGAPRAIEQAYPMLGIGGTAVLVGIPAEGATSTFDPVRLASKSQRIVGSKMGQSRISDDIPELIAHYQQGRFSLDELVSGRFAFEEINAALDRSRSGVGVRNVICIE